jgi:DNA-binding NtrC family response regulator
VLHEKIVEAGWSVHIAADLSEARCCIKGGGFFTGLILIEKVDIVFCRALHEFLQCHRALEWVGVFGSVCIDVPECSELILNYFFDFHTLPVLPDRLVYTLGHAYGWAVLWSKNVEHGAQMDNHFIGGSPAIKKLLREAKKVASVDAPVLIGGGSGSGKELTAQTIHRYSMRANGPFVAVNCGALPSTLIQSELFGYEKGAFTGASKAKQGFIESAKGGTVFLDEIGDIPLDQQTNLLRFLQEKTINRVGSTLNIPVDVRVIAASHVNIEQAVANGTFREDLYYRLNVLPLSVPSLKDRKEDIVPLAEHFFSLYRDEKNPRIKGFSSAALNEMKSYAWPGNVRELLNRVRRALVMADGRLITPRDLGLEQTAVLKDKIVLEDARDGAEKIAIQVSLRRTGNNISRAAQDLGVSRMTLYRLLEKHAISN